MQPSLNIKQKKQIENMIDGIYPGNDEHKELKNYLVKVVTTIAGAMNELGKTPDYSKMCEYAQNIEKIAIEYFELCLSKHTGVSINQMLMPELGKETLLQAEKSGRSINTFKIIELIQSNNIEDEIAQDLISMLTNHKREEFNKIVLCLIQKTQ